MSKGSRGGSTSRRLFSRFAALGGTAIIVSSLLMTIGVTAVSAADTGSKLPTTTGDPSNQWPGTPANAFTDNGQYATVRPAAGASLSQSYGTFGFSVPNGSIIDGIRVRVEANVTDAAGCTLDVRLSGNGGTSYQTKSVPLTSTTDTLYTAGSATDTWGVVWDPTQLTDTNFRVTLRAVDGTNCDDANAANNEATFAVDYFDVTITYRTMTAGTANPDLSETACDAANFNFIIDMSGSIGAQGNIPSNLPDMIAGINKFVTDFQVSGSGKYAATRFNGSSATNLTNGYISAAAFKTVISNLSNPSGLTPTGTGIAAGQNNIANPGPGQQIMFVVTDGSPNVPNTHGDDLTIPETWLQGANAAVAAANAARNPFVVEAFFVTQDGPPPDPGDVNLPFSPAGDLRWSQSVMTQIGGGSFLVGDFDDFENELAQAIHCTPDIRVTKTADNSPIPAGATAAYTIEAKNIGKGTANGVTLTDNLPAGVNWSQDNNKCAITSGTLSCNFGTMAADATQVIHVSGVTDPADCGTLPNTASATATNEPADVLGNNSGSASITVQCGSITIVKDAVPNSAQDFSFATTGTGLSGFNLDDDSDATLPNSRTFQVVPGPYTFTEGAVTGWQLTNLVCNDANGSVDLTTRKATLNVSAAEAITCTFTNTKLGSIIVEKQTSPDGAAGNFTFTGTAAGTIADNGQIVVNGLLPGTYTSTENDPTPPFDLGSIVCDDGQSATPSTGNLNTRAATFHLDAGETVKCTFTNVKRGSINIIKDAQPNDPQDFGFTTTGAGLSPFTLDDDSDATRSNTQNFPNVVPGAYSVTESAVSGWELTALDCQGTGGSTGVKAGSTANITLTPGGSVTCTYTNIKAGHILVDKVTNPTGDPASFDFQSSFGANFSLTDAAAPHDSGDLKPGTYSVAELAKTGWDLTGATCSDGSAVETISLQAGETITCTFTNVKRGNIIVDKVTTPAADPQLFTFTPSYNAGQTFQLADATAPNNSGGLVPGNYSVAEAAVAGWNLTSTSCSDGSPVTAISLQAGETVTCTFTNTKAGHILIDKVTDPAGDPASFEFDPSYSGTNFNLTDAAAPNDSGALAPGTYSVAELALAGWDLTGTSCSDQSPVTAISLQAGETVTCTFTNTKRGTIIVEKQTSPDGGPGSFTFTGDAAGSIGDGGQIVVSNLVPGTYTSTEADPGVLFDLGAIVCDDVNSTGTVGTATATFHLEPGETVTCTFTNVQRGSITIIKDAQPDSEQDFGYTTTGTGLSPFSLDDNGNDGDTLSNTQAFTSLQAGDYSVTETAVTGWDLTDVECQATGGSAAQISGATANLTLTSGGTITCVYTNSLPSIEIVKTAGDAADGETFVTLPGAVTYHYHVTNTGPVSLTGIVVTDDAGTPGDTSDDFTATCPKATLAAGESMDCSATVDVTANRTNIGTATGTSETGTNVSADDDAVVRVPSIDIDKRADDSLVEQNQTVSYTIPLTVVNGPLFGATVTDDLPAGQTYVAGSGKVNGSASEPTVSNGGKTLAWNLGTLDDGAPAATITYDVTIDADATGAPQTNQAQFCVLLTDEGQEADVSAQATPLCATSSTTVTPQLPAIHVVKTAGDAADGEVFTTEPGNVVYTYVVTNTGPLDLHDVHVTDDNGTPADTSDDVEANCPQTTLAAGTSMTCTATINVTKDTTNVAVAEGTSPEGNGVTDDDNAVVDVLVHGLVIAKSNDAPLKDVLLPDGTTVQLPTAPEGSTVTFTLAYTFAGDQVSNGIITDVLPVGLTYVDGSAMGSAEFTFVNYDSGTRTLTWRAENVDASGTVTYKAKVDAGAGRLVQPLTNVATIDSDQTEPGSDTSEVFVPVPPLVETAPPTDIAAPTITGTPGSSLPLVLAILAAIFVTVAFVTPVPATSRRRNRQR